MERNVTEQFDFTPAGVVQYNGWLNGLIPAGEPSRAAGSEDYLRFIINEYPEFR